MKWLGSLKILFVLIGCILTIPRTYVLAQSPLSKIQSEPLPLIMSTDCGTEIDDQWAVIYLTLSPEIKVLGFVGNHARNGLTGEKARDTILDVLENRLDMINHPPVLAGSDGPIESREKPNDNDAVRFLIGHSKTFTPTDRLNILVTGSCTDVASSILTDPSIVQRIRVIMIGFLDWPNGSDPWNVQNDPEAARVVFESDVPLVVGCMNVCIRDLSFTTQECRELLENTGKAGAWLEQLFAGYGTRLNVNDRSVWPIWDNIVPAHLLGFTRTIEYHRPSIARDLSFDHSNPSGQLTWIESVETERLWADFVKKLKGLLAHWALDEAVGQIAYDSAGEHDGIIHGEPKWQPAGGMVDGALLFDGVDDYIDIQFILNPGEKKSFSIFAWTKDGVPGQVIVSQKGGVNWLMSDTDDGTLRTDLKMPAKTGRGATPAGPPLISTTIINDNDWHHVGFVRAESNRVLYVDNVEVAMDTAEMLEFGDGGLYIGRGSGQEIETLWSGLIDDIRIYDKALSKEEIEALAQ